MFWDDAPVNLWYSQDSLDPSKRTYFRISEVAQLFGLTVQTIHFWLKTGRIRRHQRTSRTGSYMIPRSEVVRLLRKAGRKATGLWQEQRVRVLLIDDSRAIREFAQHAARSRHKPMDLVTASTVEDGLLLAGEFRPDVILLDYLFPKDRLRGDQALAFIRKAKQIRKSKVIAVAGDRHIASIMVKAGANGVLLKPFGLYEFRNAIFGNTIASYKVGKADYFTANSELGLTFRTSLTYPEKHPFVQKESGHRSR